MRLLSSDGFGRIEIALPEGVDVDSEEGIEALNKLSIAIATTEILECFHRFHMPLSLSKFCCLGAVLAHVLFNDGRDARGTEAGSAYCHLDMLVKCNEEKACLRCMSG